MNSPSLHPTQAFHFWSEALEHTRSRSPATFEQWFSSVQFDGFDGGVLRLCARDEFVRDWVRDHFLPILLNHLRGLTGDGLDVIWNIQPQLVAPICLPPVQSSPRSAMLPNYRPAGALGSSTDSELDSRVVASAHPQAQFSTPRERTTLSRQTFTDPAQSSGWGATGVNANSANARRSSRPTRSLSVAAGPVAQ